MQRMILNVIVGLLSFVIAIAITGLFVKQVTSEQIFIVREVVQKTVDDDYTEFSSLKDIPSDWKKEDYWLADFYLPKDIKLQPTSGSNIGCSETISKTFKKGKMILTVHPTYGAISRNFSSFKAENVLIDGMKAKIVTYVSGCVGTTDYCYKASVYFQNLEDDFGLEFRADCKNKEAQEEAKKIFGSITFRKDLLKRDK